MSDKDFKYIGEGNIENSIYTFDGTNGAFTTSNDTFKFKIERTKMTIEDGSSGVGIFFILSSIISQNSENILLHVQATHRNLNH